MKKPNNYHLFIGLVAIFVLVFYIIRVVSISNAEKQFAQNLTDGLLESSVSYAGTQYLVPPSQIFDQGNTLEPITEPVYTSIAAADIYLSDEVPGVSIEVDGQAYFYSYQILNWHEVVQDTIGDTSLLITHCSLCQSANVFETAETFSHAGKVYNNNQLLTDEETGSLWHQIRGTAIAGKRAGESLTSYPYTTMTWQQWKETYPSGVALSTDTGFDREYERHPYENYDIAKIVYFPMNTHSDAQPDKWLVDGFIGEEVNVAFGRKVMLGTGVFHFNDGEQPYVAFYDAEREAVRVFKNSDDLTFTYDFNTLEFTDDTGTVWTADGSSASGQLEEMETSSAFFMCWYATYPQTLLPFSNLEDVKEVVDDESDETTEEQE